MTQPDPALADDLEQMLAGDWPAELAQHGGAA